MMTEKNEALQPNDPVSTFEQSWLIQETVSSVEQRNELPVTTNGNLRDDSSHHDGDESSFLAGTDAEQSLTRECVEHLMREQDAELLESGANSSSGLAPVLTNYLVPSRSLLDVVPPLSLLGDDDEQQQQVAGAVKSSPVVRKRSSRSLSVLPENMSSISLLLDLDPPASDAGQRAADVHRRRALSGDVWVQQDVVVDDGIPLFDDDKISSVGQEVVQDVVLEQEQQQEESTSATLVRSESMNRRLNEAAQFAEAVGELQPTEDNELRIIEEEPDDAHDDDDDDEVPEIRVGAAIGSSSNQGPLGEQIRPKKTRPQWPFGTGGAKRIFLDKLPEQGASTQDYVYKGIKNNPPEIINQGNQSGNYAQLHRKAWLEVSDKYHRYGKNLRLYYRYWEQLGCPTNMFFDWLDSKGEAAGQPLPVLEECPRSVLDSDTVLYITNMDVTSAYAIKFIPDERGAGRAVDVDGDPVRTGPDGWIFVLRDNVMYGAQKITSISGLSKQRFHHSSFFGGKAVAAAGIFITDDNGFLTRLYPHSGHYRPGEAHMQRVLFYLHHEGVDLRTFECDMQQILHVARDAPPQKQKIVDGNGQEQAVEKKKKLESLHLVPAVLAACFLAHKARFIGNNIFAQIHLIRQAGVASVSEALEAIDSYR